MRAASDNIMVQSKNLPSHKTIGGLVWCSLGGHDGRDCMHKFSCPAVRIIGQKCVRVTMSQLHLQLPKVPNSMLCNKTSDWQLVRKQI